jgi:hypothetical protein
MLYMATGRPRLKWEFKSKDDEADEACSMRERDEKCREELLGRPRHGWRIMLEWILEKQGGKVWAGFIWLKIVTSGGLL